MSARQAPTRKLRPAAPTTPQDIAATLRQLIQENAGIPASLVRGDSTIDGDLAMDSFSFISLQVAVEDTFGIVCDPAEIEACKRFDAIVTLVGDKVEAERRTAPRRAARPTAVTSEAQRQRPSKPRARK